MATHYNNVARIEDFNDPILKVPPHSIEAEQAVLGGVMVDPEAINKVAELIKPAEFYKGVHAHIYEAILELYDQGEPIDIISVSEILNENKLLDNVGGRSYINDLAINVVTTANIEWYARQIHKYYLLRRLITIGSEITETAFEEKDSDTAIDKAQQAIFELAQEGMPVQLSHIKDILPTTFEQIEERHANKGSLMGVSTGFYELDTLTSGLQKSDLLIVAARPSMGKTAFCLNMATHIALREKKPVLVFSLEMSKEQLVTRMLCSEAELDAQKIRTGQITEADFTKIGNAMAKLGEAPLFIDDTPGMTVMELRAKARKLQIDLKQELGLIVIDYLQLMEGTSEGGSFGDSRTQVISAISRGLKSIAREINVPVIALSQLSRAVESRQDKKPMLSDLRESGSIEQDADIVMFIYRDEYYNKDTERPGIADILITKQRNGPVGEVELLFRHNWTKFLNPADRKIQIF